MNLLPTNDQEQVIDAVKAFLRGEAPVERLRPQHGQVGNNDHLLWEQLGELGFWALAIPDEVGGAGLSICEEYLLFREFGRHLISLGALGLILGARIAMLGKADDAFTAIVAGNAKVAIGNPRGSVNLGPRSSGLWHLLEGKDADWVITWSDDGAALFRADQFTIVEDVLAMDSHMTLLRAELKNVEPHAFIPAEVENLHLRALILIAAYAVGVAEAARDMAVDYAKIREQFGQPIGKFQAVKHRCADMAIRTEVAYCQATYAAVALNVDEADKAPQVTAAVMLATETALKNSADNIQIHGAFGFTAEGDAHLFLKRSHTLDFLSGGLRTHKQNLLKQYAVLETEECDI